MINRIISYISKVFFPYSLYAILSITSYFEPKFGFFVLLFIMSIIGVLRTISNASYVIPIFVLMFILFIRIINTKKIDLLIIDWLRILLGIFLIHRIVYFIVALHHGFEIGISNLAIFCMGIFIYWLCYEGLEAGIFTSSFIEKLILFMLAMVSVGSSVYLFLYETWNVELGPQLLGINSNNFGALYSGVLIFFLIRYHNQLLKFKNIGFIGIFFVSILLSQSRAALIAFVMTYILFLLRYKRISTFLTGCIVIAMVLFIVFQFISFPITDKFRIMEEAYYYKNYTVVTSCRINMIIGAINYIREGGLPRLFLGGGIGSFRMVAPIYFNLPDLQTSVHNHYFDILTKFGLIGLLIYMGLIIKICVDSYKSFKTTKSYFAAGIFFLMVNYIICDMFGNRFVGISTFFIWPLIAVFYFRKYRGLNMEIVKRKNDYTCANTS